MKTVVIISDTHRNLAPLEKIERVLDECDYIIHLGDETVDGAKIRRKYPRKTFCVAGNNDPCSAEPSESILEIEGRRIFYCHGHRYGVRQTLQKLAQEAKANRCDIALYGHTHVSCVREVDGVLCINPGACARFEVNKSYCYLVIVGEKAVATVVNL